MLRRNFSKRARDELAFCHRLLHIPYNKPELDSTEISEIIDIISKREPPPLQEPQHWRKNWQDLRKNRLTASNFSHAIGFFPESGSRRELWLEKVGISKPFSGNRATLWDNDNEREALVSYNESSGNQLITTGFVVHEKENWLGASPDALIDADKDGVTSSGVLEVKCPFEDGVKVYPWKKVPWKYVPQIQGLMEIVDRDWLDLYCWTVNGRSLFRIWRDTGFWDDMKPALVDFWEKHVLPAREMYNNVDVKDPHLKIREFTPMPCHEDCEKITRNAKRISENANRLFYEIDGRIVD